MHSTRHNARSGVQPTTAFFAAASGVRLASGTAAAAGASELLPVSQVSNCFSIAANAVRFGAQKKLVRWLELSPRLLCHVPLARPLGCVFFFRVPSTRDTFRLFRMAFIVPLLFARQLAPSLPAARFWRVLFAVMSGATRLPARETPRTRRQRLLIR